MASTALPAKTIYFEPEEDQESSEKEYKNLIATLPKASGWKGFDFCQYKGIWYTSFVVEGIISAQNNFKPKPTDIIVSSAPKSGTTWLKALTFAIVTRNQYDETTSPLLTKVSHECIPLYEIDLVEKHTTRDPNLPLLATHVSFTALPKSTLDSGCKIVYICRDPKDACVSNWFHSKRLLPEEETPSMEECLELFCKGLSHGGPYWDHALEYWKASLEWPEKVLFLKYEELKRDTMFYVKRLADFMGYPFSAEEEEQGLVQRIVELCSFEKMSNLEVNKRGSYFPLKNFQQQNNIYFRKGLVGDWRNHMTAEMAACLDKIVEEKLKGSGLTLNAAFSE